MYVKSYVCILCRHIHALLLGLENASGASVPGHCPSKGPLSGRRRYRGRPVTMLMIYIYIHMGGLPNRFAHHRSRWFFSGSGLQPSPTASWTCAYQVGRRGVGSGWTSTSFLKWSPPSPKKNATRALLHFPPHVGTIHTSVCPPPEPVFLLLSLWCYSQRPLHVARVVSQWAHEETSTQTNQKKTNTARPTERHFR